MVSSDFDRSIEVHRDSLFKFILKKTNLNYELTEDIVQIAFIKAYKYKKNNDDQIHTFKPWLYQIAINTLFDYYKSSNKIKYVNQTDYVKLQDSYDEYFIDSFDLEKHVESKIYIEELQKALNFLKKEKPDLYKIFYQYIHVGDMKHISCSENISLGTVKSRIHRSRRYIENYLEQNNVALFEEKV